MMVCRPPTTTAERQAVRQSINAMRRNTYNDWARQKNCKRYNRPMPMPTALVVDEEPKILGMPFRALRYRIKKLGIE
jgi:hypothetical protein